MCLVKYPDDWRHRKQDQDFVTYKVMEGCGRNKEKLEPLYFHNTCRYDIGETMEPLVNVSLENLDNRGKLEEGVIHSFVDYHKAIQMFEEFVHWGQLDEVFYLLECTVPRDTPYWTSFNGDCASTKLVLTKVIRKASPSLKRIQFVW